MSVTFRRNELGIPFQRILDAEGILPRLQEWIANFFGPGCCQQSSRHRIDSLNVVALPVQLLKAGISVAIAPVPLVGRSSGVNAYE